MEYGLFFIKHYKAQNKTKKNMLKSHRVKHVCEKKKKEKVINI